MNTHTATPIPAEMTIVDNRDAYARKEFNHRYSMPVKTRELATANRNERFTKGLKFIIQLRIGRVVKARREAAEKCRALGLTGSYLR